MSNVATKNNADYWVWLLLIPLKEFSLLAVQRHLISIEGSILATHQAVNEENVKLKQILSIKTLKSASQLISNKEMRVIIITQPTLENVTRY